MNNLLRQILAASLRLSSNWTNRIALFSEARFRVVVFLISLIAHIPYIFGRYLPRESLKYFSADENALIRVIERYQSHFAAGDWGSILSEKLDYGYGFLYYLSYSVFTYPFALLAGDEGILAAGRLLSAIFESATIMLVCVIAKRVDAPAWLILLLGVAMAFTPGLMVIHKPLSAEQLSNLLIVAGAVCALTMPLSSLRKNLFFIGTLAAAAISIKFNAALQGVFFAIIVLFRLYEKRIDYWLSTELLAEKVKSFMIDCGVIAAGLSTFFVWNLPLLVSAASRENFVRWLVVQAQSNQNSQRGSVSYSGIHEWWPKIDSYFGDTALLPWILSSGVLACVLGVFLKSRRDASFYALLALVWVGVPAAYVILTVKKVWLWYLVMPGMFLLLGPVFLYVVGCRLRKLGLRLIGGGLAAIAVLFLTLQVYVAIPDYAALASERWRETEREDFADVEALRVSLTREIAGRLNDTSIIVDPRLTLPVDQWSRAGAKIYTLLLPNINENLIEEQKPTYIVIRLWGYAHHHGNREKALADFQFKLKAACENAHVCYDELGRYEPSKTIVYRRQSQ